MQKLPMARLMVLAVAAMFGLMTVGSSTATARPQYVKAFKAQYDGKITPINCTVCHPGMDKKEKNNFGQAFGKSLGAKNVKEEEKLKESLEATVKEKSKVDGKTFADLIEAGKAPASEE
ncbi:MAG: hypothetical protein ACRDD1_16145 [Planctomycetia bacterium]